MSSSNKRIASIPKKILKTQSNMLEAYRQELLKQPPAQRWELITGVGNQVERRPDCGCLGAYVQLIMGVDN